MKYIKKFENKKNHKYKIGDYILMKKGILLDELRLAKIVNLYKDPEYYDIEFVDGWITDMSDKFIDRLLTKEEIEQYEADKESKKYNL